MKKLLFIAVIVITIGNFSFAQTKNPKAKVEGEKLITEMMRSKNMPLLFRDDGVFINTELEDDSLPPEVRKILELEEKAIPLLIAHLDDTRLMPMTSCCSQPSEITVGDACLNILTVITKTTQPMFDEKCEEDYKSSCLKAEYSFLTGSFTKRGKRRIPSKDVVTAKQNWLKAYRKNQIKFEQYFDLLEVISP